MFASKCPPVPYIPGFGNFAGCLNSTGTELPLPQLLLAQGQPEGSDPRLFAQPVKNYLCAEIVAASITVQAKRQSCAKLILGHQLPKGILPRKSFILSSSARADRLSYN